MKRRDFIIKSAIAGAALSAYQLFPSASIRKLNSS